MVDVAQRRKPVVVLAINSLGAGGAERQVVELAQALSVSAADVHVVVSYDAADRTPHTLRPALRESPSLSVHTLGKRQGPFGYVRFLLRMVGVFAELSPDAVYAFLDASLPALVAGRLVRARVIWGVRRTFSNLADLPQRTRTVVRMRIALARYADAVIFNSEASRANHRGLGMVVRAAHVIPNGIDCDRFHPALQSVATKASRWRRRQADVVVGIVARLDPVKSHETFLQAAATARSMRSGLVFVCVGGGTPERLATLRSLAAEYGIAGDVVWHGECHDIEQIYRELDVLVLSSVDEGFPNAVAEAMASGVPCVVTDAGDAAAIVGDTGVVVGVGDALALARAVVQLADESPIEAKQRSAACRSRIESAFGVERLVKRTLEAILPGGPCGC